ncbi:MAG: sulfite exporter TauE/SafE family protein [Gammaproteobacteria bacterium]|nr:sulfite exporter TauE/SafE family protein [Gammaproteobacteria bacterium]
MAAIVGPIDGQTKPTLPDRVIEYGMYFEVADLTASIPLLLAWGVIVGLVYSTVGAAGGILASVGLITVFGIQNPNLVKPMAQTLTLVTPLIAVPLYLKQCRVAYILAAILGVGGILGAIIGSSLSAMFLTDMSLFKPVFAVLVFFIAAQMIWQLVRHSSESNELTHTMRAAECFGQWVKSGGEPCERGVKLLNIGFSRIVLEFGNQEFSYHPLLPFFTGMGIAILSSALGVGGGFLLVPFMSIIMRLPMYIIAGTSALAISLHSMTSIANYVRMGVELDYALLGFLVIGVVAGSVVGPLVSRFIPERGLRGFLSVVLLLIALRYTGLF